MAHALDPVLETWRLTLRRISVDDAAFMHQLLNEPSFLRFIGDRGVRTVDDARTFIITGPIASYDRLGFGLYLVLARATGEPMGICGLLKRDTLQDVDLGFAFLPRYWSQGYALEAATGVLAYARDILGLRRIVAITSPDNVRSAALLEKLQFRLEGLVQLSSGEPEVRLFAVEIARPWRS